MPDLGAYEPDPSPPALPALPSPAEPGSGWKVESVAALMRALERRNGVQASLIREAARHGGVLTREQVYEIAGFPRDRTLRGLTRPPTRVTGDLIEAGVVADDAEYPFRAEYATGVRASHFRVPPDLVDALLTLGPPTGA